MAAKLFYILQDKLWRQSKKNMAAMLFYILPKRNYGNKNEYFLKNQCHIDII